MVAQVVAEEQQARRPVAVRIVSESEQGDVEEEQASESAAMKPRLVVVPVSA